MWFLEVRATHCRTIFFGSGFGSILKCEVCTYEVLRNSRLETDRYPAEFTGVFFLQSF